MKILFYINTLIRRPDKTITDLSILKSKQNDYFVDINNMNDLKSIEHILDFDYLEGAIIIKFNDQILMDVTTWDLVDDLWAYLLNVIENVLNTGYGETYFPDQPLRLSMRSLSNDLLLFELDAPTQVKAAVPKRDFLLALIEGADYFFEKMNESYVNNVDYNGEIDMIESLRKKFLADI
ncbi:hypothetical protein ABEO83_04120 [Bacillus glycinifermentans]|uniref:hypothetical protein n=1 Tax=Bacillus glycinifermentans TaxID=1664069 RepID=UPI003D2155D4